MVRNHFRNWLLGLAGLGGIFAATGAAVAQVPGEQSAPRVPSIADSPNERGIAQPSRSTTFSTQGGLNSSGTSGSAPVPQLKRYNYPTEPDFDPRTPSPYDRRYPRYQYRAPTSWSAGWSFSGYRSAPRYGDFGVPYSPRFSHAPIGIR